MNLERLDLTYSIDALAQGPTLCLTVESQSAAGPLGQPAKYPLSAIQPVHAAAAAVVQALEEPTSRIGDGHPAGSRNLSSHLRETLIPRARTLAALVLPPSVAEVILASPVPLAIGFRIDPTLNGIPFEALFLGHDFIAFTHAIGRELTAGGAQPQRPACPPAAQGPVRAAFLVDPCPRGDTALGPDLVDAAKATLTRWRNAPESTRISFAGPSVSIREGLTATRLAGFLQSHSAIIALAHHQDRRHAPPEAPETEGLVILDPSGQHPTLFPPAAFLASLQPPAQPPELVFWLACESGLTSGWAADWPADTRLHGFVDAALRAGVRHFIGSRLLVPQTAAVDLIQPFLTAAAQGCAIGEALRRARVAARRDVTDPAGGGSLVGLAFALFGRPWQGLLTGGGERLGGALAHPCQEVTAGTRCSRLYRPTEPGARFERCAHHLPAPPPPPPPPRPPGRCEPCANPYQLHAGPVPWVTPIDDGWCAELWLDDAAYGKRFVLCPECLSEAGRQRHLA